MSAHHVSALLVPSAGEFGIVTDADFRQKVLAGGVSPEAPVTAIMSRPLLTVRSKSICGGCRTRHAVRGRAALGGNRHTRHHRRVSVRGRPHGAGLLEPLCPSRRHLQCPKRSGPQLCDQRAARTFRRPGPGRSAFKALDIGRVLALNHDAVTTRLLDFAIARHGPAPCAWAWFALGSVARRELTLASDQDNALAYADPADPEVDAYFERVAQDVNAGLARAGFGADISGVMAGNALWRMSKSQWVQTFRDCLESPDHSHLVRAVVAFDFRHVAGGLEVTPPLVAVLQEAREHQGFLAQLARTATDAPPALPHRFFAARWNQQEVDLKKGGIVPIANLARFHALANGITISSTLDRLVAAEGLGAINKETAQSLREAFVSSRFGLISTPGKFVPASRPIT